MGEGGKAGEVARTEGFLIKTIAPSNGQRLSLFARTLSRTSLM